MKICDLIKISFKLNKSQIEYIDFNKRLSNLNKSSDSKKSIEIEIDQLDIDANEIKDQLMNIHENMDDDRS